MDLSILGKNGGPCFEVIYGFVRKKKMRYVSLPGLKRRRKKSVPDGQVFWCHSMGA